ncbi:MAG: TMEM165/GDT1 family protein [Rhodospirillales bacterium]|jgi:putative Ca2+/H+ antiporter (TMEM165/GDT1 family)|nr:hypothetical protein [Rhodospirillaceae bacterium]MDP6427209.1 TMEM165/GDT1 family protein [Rhodospirillales bacterium]MDP6645405.1 TMEM165/GDT1 family protein [Rhodospirillales bacterium]MDP6841327.1 TMEM165/GDT1 family protein [Rhodospirillales bacterium]|tara:strand:+ start:611 stop:892 length:282 start_codon:yes stop_codon:yes gene_type:complete
MSQLIAIFTAIFIAELGDKTQLATLLFAADRSHHPVAVFIAAAGALVTSTAVAVGLGALGARYLTFIPLKAIAGIGFIGIGIWMLTEYLRPAA